MGDDRKPTTDRVLLSEYARHRGREAGARNEAERKALREGRPSVFKPLQLGEGDAISQNYSGCRCKQLDRNAPAFSQILLSILQPALGGFDKFGLKSVVVEDEDATGAIILRLKMWGTVPQALVVAPEA